MTPGITTVVLAGLLFLTMSSSIHAVEAFVFSNDLVAVEAEDLQPSPQWQLQSSPAGFTGKGWMKYTGPARHGINNTDKFEDWCDNKGEYQGNESDWLKIPVYIDKPGQYAMQVRAYHTTSGSPVGGDATVYTHIKNYPVPVKVVHGATEAPNKFNWVFGPPGMYEGGKFYIALVVFKIDKSATPSIATFYLAGRETGFGADRIHIYRFLGDPARVGWGAWSPDLRNVNAPLAKKQDINAPLFGVMPTSIDNKALHPIVRSAALRVSVVPEYDLAGRAVTGIGGRSAGTMMRINTNSIFLSR
jgi:hypothetical protein